MLNNRYHIIGSDWLEQEIGDLTDSVIHVSPSDFNEQNRYLTEAVTPRPGYLSYKVTPHLKEIVDCFDVRSDVREVNVMKGTQIGYTTLLESVLLYYMFFIRTKTLIFFTAERDMANERVDSCFIPMINQSGFQDRIRSGDIDNARKTGKTRTKMQFDGGGQLLWFGVRNAAKFRMWAAPILAKDEIDAWAQTVGSDGCPDALTDQRAKSYPHEKKILRGSSPLIKDVSKIERAFLVGDQRRYFVRCLDCGFAQYLGWIGNNPETGADWGFAWETENDLLIEDSVRYRCRDCGHEHFEHDKQRLFSADHGAEWKPTATAKKPHVRSYHIPAMLSGLGMCTWANCVQEYLDGWDPIKKKIKDAGRYQSWRNNILGKTYEIKGAKVRFQQVSAHRRAVYRMGEIPNAYAERWSGSKILLLTCTVDVHKHFLAVAVIGWCRDSRQYLIDRIILEDDHEDGCGRIESPVWGELQQIINEKTYTCRAGISYRIAVTFIDSGYNHDVVCEFCSQFETVMPILGRGRTEKSGSIKEFQPFTTKIGTEGLKILVDNYKERIAPVLRREWHEEAEIQDKFHFNAPIDLPDDALRELTRETRMRKVDEKGQVSFYWHRPDGARNELWDLLVYAHAALEYYAYSIWVQHFEQEYVDWNQFWTWLEEEQFTFAMP